MSKTPGRTQLISVFRCAHRRRSGGFTGLRLRKSRQGSPEKLAEAAVNHYLSYRDALVGIVLVMDIRHPNQAFDQQMLDWASASELRIHVLLNKADKLGNGAQKQALNKMRNLYKEHPTVSFQTFSALRGTGKSALIATLLDWLALPIDTNNAEKLPLTECNAAGLSEPDPSFRRPQYPPQGTIELRRTRRGTALPRH